MAQPHLCCCAASGPGSGSALPVTRRAWSLKSVLEVKECFPLRAGRVVRQARGRLCVAFRGLRMLAGISLPSPRYIGDPSISPGNPASTRPPRPDVRCSRPASEGFRMSGLCLLLQMHRFTSRSKSANVSDCRKLDGASQRDSPFRTIEMRPPPFPDASLSDPYRFAATRARVAIRLTPSRDQESLM